MLRLASLISVALLAAQAICLEPVVDAGEGSVISSIVQLAFKPDEVIDKVYPQENQFREVSKAHPGLYENMALRASKASVDLLNDPKGMYGPRLYHDANRVAILHSPRAIGRIPIGNPKLVVEISRRSYFSRLLDMEKTFKGDDKWKFAERIKLTENYLADELKSVLNNYRLTWIRLNSPEANMARLESERAMFKAEIQRFLPYVREIHTIGGQPGKTEEYIKPEEAYSALKALLPQRPVAPKQPVTPPQPVYPATPASNLRSVPKDVPSFYNPNNYRGHMAGMAPAAPAMAAAH